jgi:L-ascorbate metabolism protein UlaG (beta-lactamase superfamily)
MEFEYKGANCVVITTKQGVLVTDGRLSTVGLKNVQPKDAIELATQTGFASDDGRVAVDMPGEYEISDISILGVAATRMIDFDGSFHATMYRVAFPDVTIAILGHVSMPLTDEQLESLGVIDVLIVPVGGGGYTLDSHLAVSIVHKIDPRVIIPTHYADSQTKYEVPQEELEPFIKELGVAHEVMPKWKIKNGILPELQTVIELTRTS